MSAPNSTSVTPEPNGTPDAELLRQVQAKHDRLEQTVRELREQVAALEAERDRLQSESETYRKSLQYMLGKYEPFEMNLTRADLDEMEKSGTTLAEVIKALEAQ
jgi:hypothetical protein